MESGTKLENGIQMETGNNLEKIRYNIAKSI